MDLNKPVSGRELARLTGQTEGAVRKARDRSSIVEGLTADGKYIPIIASNEWGKEILPEFLNQKIPEIKPPIIKIEKPKKAPIQKKEKKEAETIEEVVSEIMHEILPKANADDLDDETVSKDLDDKILKPEAERVTAVLKAKILQITYQEKQKQLVPIDKVNSVLFGYGVEIRNTFEGLPAQVIDKIRACDSRHEALRVLNDSIFDALNILADIETREF